jgi:hypothetical protein
VSFKLVKFGFTEQARRAGRMLFLGVQMEALVRQAALALEGDIKRRVLLLSIFDTGAYGGSWGTSHVPGVGYAVASNIAYGPFQEYGTGRAGAATHETFAEDEPPVHFDPSWPGMEARPHVRPAAAEARKGLEAAGQALVRKAIT